MPTSPSATKQDVEEIVGRVVGEIVGDALQMISERFDDVEVDLKDLSTITMRIDNRLGDNIETGKTHTAQIRQIQRKLA